MTNNFQAQVTHFCSFKCVLMLIWLHVELLFKKVKAHIKLRSCSHFHFKTIQLKKNRYN